MRILLTTDTIGGVWSYTRELSEGLLEAGCAVRLVSFGRVPSVDQEEWAKRTTRAYLRSFEYVPTEYPLEWMQENARCYAEPAELLARIARDFQADVLHSNQLCFGALASRIANLVVVHSDVLSWSAACRDAEPEPSPWLSRYKALALRGLRGADHVTAPSAWMLAQASRSFGPFASSSVIANGRKAGDGGPGSGRKLQAVTAGRLWDEGKNVRLLYACESPMPLLIAGETAGPDAVMRTPLADGPVMLGRLNDAEMLSLLRESAIYIVTSAYEPFGLAAVEAAHAGCAIVANDIASLREVWGEAALYFSDAASLTRLLAELAANPEQLGERANAAQRRAKTLYSREKMVDAYLALYGSLLATQREETTLDVA